MFYVQVLGSSSAMPLHGRHHSAQWLHCEGTHFLLDCGEGTQNRILRLGLKLHKLESIFVSHLHADHVLGLGGLLTTLHMQGHQKPLYLWGPPGLRALVEQQLQGTFSALRYPFFIREVLPLRQPVALWENAHLEVYAFPLQHGVPTLGYLFRERPKPPRINGARLQALGLPTEALSELRKGNTVTHQGKTYSLQDFLLPPSPPKSYAYCTDTHYAPQIADFVSGVTVLYHEATFLSEHGERAHQTFHSTAREAALIARACGAQRLYIGHFSTRYRDLRPLLEEARSTFPETYLAEEGHLYPIE